VDEIRTWYDRQTGKVRAKFDSRLKFLVQTDRSGWKPEPFRDLHGECKGLGEIRFKADHVQHRPLGFFGPGRIFTVVLCAKEKGDRFVPKEACHIGLSRKAEIEANTERSHVCNFALE
jgi:hypothetical protein